MSSTSRVAIVTGAARGIGASIAERLADDGHAIAVIDLDEAACAATVERIAAAGGRAIAVGANVAAEQAVAVADGSMSASALIVKSRRTRSPSIVSPNSTAGLRESAA